jgi:hypothetical protein
MSPDVEHALALWRAYDQAVIENRQATAAAIAASKTFSPPKSKRQISPEARASTLATLRADAARRASFDAYYALGLVFDESPNESAGDPSPAEPPTPTLIGTREPVKIRDLFPGMAPSTAVDG